MSIIYSNHHQCQLYLFYCWFKVLKIRQSIQNLPETVAISASSTKIPSKFCKFFLTSSQHIRAKVRVGTLRRSRYRRRLTTALKASLPAVDAFTLQQQQHPNDPKQDQQITDTSQKFTARKNNHIHLDIAYKQVCQCTSTLVR